MKDVRKAARVFNKGKKDEYLEMKTDIKMGAKQFARLDKGELHELKRTIRLLREETVELAKSYRNAKEMVTMVENAEKLFLDARAKGAGQGAINDFEKAAALLYRVRQVDKHEINYDNRMYKINNYLTRIADYLQKVEEAKSKKSGKA